MPTPATRVTEFSLPPVKYVPGRRCDAAGEHLVRTNRKLTANHHYRKNFSVRLQTGHQHENTYGRVLAGGGKVETSLLGKLWVSKRVECTVRIENLPDTANHHSRKSFSVRLQTGHQHENI